MLLSEDELQFSTQSDDNGGEDVYMFATLNQSELFATYRIESKSNNEVCFLVPLENLSKALHSGKVVSSTGRNENAWSS